VEAYFLALLVITALAVVWFAGFVVYRLLRDPR
jgi:hypothetical protein